MIDVNLHLARFHIKPVNSVPEPAKTISVPLKTVGDAFCRISGTAKLWHQKRVQDNAVSARSPTVVVVDGRYGYRWDRSPPLFSIVCLFTIPPIQHQAAIFQVQIGHSAGTGDLSVVRVYRTQIVPGDELVLRAFRYPAQHIHRRWYINGSAIAP